MKASIIIPAFNRGYIVAEAIQSILDQTCTNYELIVVDDGSTDDTIDVARRFRDDRIRIIKHPKNAGVAAARNTGIGAAQGDFVSFLDSDDLWEREKLKLDMEFFDNHPEVDAVFTDVRLEGEHATSSVARRCPVFAEFLGGACIRDGIMVPKRTMYLCMLQEMPIRIQATTFRRAALGGNWRFDEAWRSGEDWELLLRFTRNHDWGFIDRSLVVQRPMPDSTLGRYQKADALFLTEMCIREKRSLSKDREGRDAISRSIVKHSDRLGYWYQKEGKILDSAKAYLTGFREGGDKRLLLKALALLIPHSIRSQIKRFVKMGPL